MNPTPQQTAQAAADSETVELVQLNAQIKKDLRHRLKVKATQESTTMSELINKWVREYVDGER